MDDKFKLKRTGTPLSEIWSIYSGPTGRSDYLLKELEGLGFDSVERLYSSIIGSPEAFQVFFKVHGENLSTLIGILEAYLPVSFIKEVKEYIAPEYGMGLVLPEDFG
jgi:hypothetical protein